MQMFLVVLMSLWFLSQQHSKIIHLASIEQDFSLEQGKEELFCPRSVTDHFTTVLQKSMSMSRREKNNLSQVPVVPRGKGKQWLWLRKVTTDP